MVTDRKKGSAADRAESVFVMASPYQPATEDEGVMDADGEAEAGWLAGAKQWASRLEEARLMVLLSDGEELLRQATDRIVKRRFKDPRTDRLILHFDDDKMQRLRLGDVIEDCHRADAGLQSDGKVLLIVNATHRKARLFVEDLWQLSSSYITDTVKPTFAKRGLWVLIRTTRTLVGARSPDERRALLVETIEVLGPCVERLCERQASGERISPAQVKELCSRIKEQQGQRHTVWARAERELYSQLWRLKDADELEQALKGNEQGPALLQGMARDLLKEPSPIKVAALYVATFLPNLTVTDFDRAVSAVLKGRKVREPEVVRTIQKDDHCRTIVAHKVHYGEVVWARPHSNLLSDCNIRASPDNSAGFGTRGIGFARPGLREAMAQALQESDPLIHVHILQKIQETDLLFSAGPELRRGIVRLLIQSAGMDREEFYRRWLLPSLDYFLTSRQDEAMPEQHGEIQERERAERLADMLIMLLSARQRGLVDRCLDRLLDIKEYPAFTVLVRHLRDEEEFDELRWLRCLITGARGGDEGEESKGAQPEGGDNNQAIKAGNGELIANQRPEDQTSSSGHTRENQDHIDLGNTGQGKPDMGKGHQVGSGSDQTTPDQPQQKMPVKGRPRFSSRKQMLDGSRALALDEYLDHDSVMRGHPLGIRRIMACMLDWSREPDTPQGIFAQWLLLERLDDLRGMAWEMVPQRSSPLLSALASEGDRTDDPRLSTWRKLVCALLGHDLDDATDQRVNVVLSSVKANRDGSMTMDERVSFITVLCLLPGKLSSILTPEHSWTLLRHITKRFHDSFTRSAHELRTRGEPNHIAIRHLFQTLHLMGWCLLLEGDQDVQAAPEATARLDMLLDEVIAATDMVQRRRFIINLAAMEEAGHSILSALSSVSRASNPRGYDAVRGRLLGVRRRSQELRARLDRKSHASQSQFSPERS